MMKPIIIMIIVIISNTFPALKALHAQSHSFSQQPNETLSLISNFTDKGTEAKKVYVTGYTAGHSQHLEAASLTLEQGLEVIVVYTSSLLSPIDANKAKHFHQGKKSLYT